jgi:zinc transport system substrate-binding protein
MRREDWRMLKSVLVLALFLASAGHPAPAAEPARPVVVVTLKPVHSLVAGVMAGVASPELLIEGAASPHDYALKPSDARLLARADAIVAIGPGMEGFLARPLRTLAAKARLLELAKVDGMTLPAAEGGPDLHLWLDPENAKRAVAAVAALLTEIDPAHAYEYARGAFRVGERLAALDRELRATLGPVRDRPFLVYHDAFRGFAGRYRLALAGSVVTGPEHQPGARRIAELRAKIAATGARCLFVEPQFEPSQAEALARDTGLRLAQLDDLGAALPEGPEMYFALMRDNAEALRACLAAP